MVMVVMLALSAVAASMLINSFLGAQPREEPELLEHRAPGRRGRVGRGIDLVAENQASIPAAPPWSDISGVWPQTLSGTVFTDSDGRSARYTVTMRYKREWRDVNGDGDCTDPGESSGYQDNDGSPATDCPGDIVIYNKCSGADKLLRLPGIPLRRPPLRHELRVSGGGDRLGRHLRREQATARWPSTSPATGSGRSACTAGSRPRATSR